MNTLLLLLGLLLPWLVGQAWLGPLRQHLHLSTTAALGYGYFLGCAALYLTLLAWGLLVPEVPAWLMVASLLGLAAAGLWLGRRYRAGRIAAESRPGAPGAGAAGQRHRPAHTPRGWQVYALVLVLVVLLLAHLAWVLVDIYYRPVFPWDAWQTWLYKAKVWYFSGGPVSLAAPESWAASEAGRGIGPLSYNAQGHNYPGLWPAQAWWAATSFGSWQENRVTWPALHAGAALCLALWGQLRSATGSRRVALVGVFALLSLPLTGAHLSLPGYADLWLAGYSGLGLLALMRGLQGSGGGQVVLGLAWLLLGLLVKHDALIWLAAGIGICALHYRPRNSLLLMALGGLGLLAWRWPLPAHNVLPAYGEHLFLFSTWHVLWYLAAAGFLGLCFNRRLREWRPIAGSFLLMLLASQAVVFGFSDAAAWASDGTAINRLLLQVTPALIWLLLASYGSTHTDRATGQAPEKPGITLLAGTLAALVLGCAVALWLQLQAPGGAITTSVSPSTTTTRPGDFPASRLQAVMGQVRREGNALRVERYTDGVAMLSSGPIALNAAELPLLELTGSGNNRKQRTLFWRRADSPDALHRRAIGPDETSADLRREPEWRGRIIELGLVFYQDGERHAELQQLSLQSASPGKLFGLATQQWRETGQWSQRSTHGIRGTASEALLPLPLLAGGWMLLSLGLLALVSRQWPTLRTAAPIALLAWLLLDLHWLHTGWHQATATRAHYRDSALPEALDMGEDEETARLARHLRQTLGEQPTPVAIGMASAGMRFDTRRLKYLLLPHPAYVHDGIADQLPLGPANVAVIMHLRTHRNSPAIPRQLPPQDGRLQPSLQYPMARVYTPR